MSMRFNDKVALVTGAAQGIGRGVVERLLLEGARVVAVDRSELVHELAPEVLALTADLERYEDCQRVVARAVEHFGRLDILINNVGGTIWAKPFEHYLPAEIEAEVRRSLFPTLWCCHSALPHMLEQGSGVIVNVSSIAGMTGLGSNLAYAAAKAGIDALTKGLAKTLAPHIRVLAVSPGVVDSGFVAGRDASFNAKTGATIPLQRVGTPDDVAASIQACCTTLRYATGSIFVADGGRHL